MMVKLFSRGENPSDGKGDARDFDESASASSMNVSSVIVEEIIVSDFDRTVADTII